MVINDILNCYIPSLNYQIFLIKKTIYNNNNNNNAIMRLELIMYLKWMYIYDHDYFTS